jgi:thioredoxin reductase (NADPH)
LDTKEIDTAKPPSYDVLIIGGGPSGTTAAIYTSRANLKTLVIDKGLTSGALGSANKIANYPGFSEAISGAELLERMRMQARTFGTEFAVNKAIGVDLLSEMKTVYGNNGAYTGESIIIATGSMGRGSRVKGEDELLGRGVSYCATCDAAFFREKDVLVAGNSDEAIEDGLFLTKFARQVYFLSPTSDLKAPKAIVDELISNPKVKLYLGANLQEIIGKEQVEGVRFTLTNEKEQIIPVAGTFVYLRGNKPITDFLQGQLEISDTGCLMVDKDFKTAVAGVYAIGDVLCNHVRQIVIATSEGAIAGMAVEKYLRGHKKENADLKG